MDYNIIFENWLKKCIKSLTQSTIHFSLSLNKKGREYFLADKIPNSPRTKVLHNRSKRDKKTTGQKIREIKFLANFTKKLTFSENEKYTKRNFVKLILYIW